MSSTKRGSQRSEADAYGTPPWCTHRALEAIPGLPHKGVWMDPCAGEGAIIRAVNQVRPGILWTASELRPEAEVELAQTNAAYVIQDFLDDSYKPGWVDVICTNPPFRLAQEFIEKSLRLAGQVVMLLRLNYLGSEKRADFLREFHPDVYVLPNRPSFTDGQTDSIEYAWFHWVSGRSARSGQVRILASTPKEERKAGRRVPEIQDIDEEEDDGDAALCDGIAP